VPRRDIALEGELVLEEFGAPALEPPEHGAQEAPGGDGDHAADEQQLDDA